MAVNIRMDIYDEDEAERRQQPGVVGVNFDGITVNQAEIAIAYLNPIKRKLEEFIMKKYGEGQVLPEPGDAPVPDDSFSDEDRKDLAEENEKADTGE